MNEALLALEDGTLFWGVSACGPQAIAGEVVFHTAFTGYQEICTDPSYAGQIVVFTNPHIGNTGVNRFDHESDRIEVKGVAALSFSRTPSHYQSDQTFLSFLEEHQTPWIEGMDTRKLTRHLREKGTKRGCLMTGKIDPSEALERAKRPCAIEKPLRKPFQSVGGLKIAVCDWGVKAHIIKKLTDRGCAVKLFSGESGEILSWKPDGIVLSNGPGDPMQMEEAIQETQKLIASRIPLFGICLGCQLIALSLGAKTVKMPFGHHGANHPVYDLLLEKVVITSQNHLFAVDESSLPPGCIVTHRSLFDGSVQGIRVQERPIWGFQGHPEGSPGPQELDLLFHEFLEAACR